MEIRKNADKEKQVEPATFDEIPDRIDIGSTVEIAKPIVKISAVGGAGVHSTDEVYNQVKTLLGIPQNEPIFILRGQDVFATKTIRGYRDRVRDGIRNRPDNFQDWYDNVGEVINDFVVWFHGNKETSKVPD